MGALPARPGCRSGLGPCLPPPPGVWHSPSLAGSLPQPGLALSRAQPTETPLCTPQDPRKMSRSTSSEALPLGSSWRPGASAGTVPQPGLGVGGAPARIQAWLQPGPRSLHFRACAPRSLEAQLLAERGAPFFPEGARVQASGAPPTGVQTPSLHPPAGPPESPWSLCGFAGSPGVGVGRARRDPANHVSTPERQNLPREPLVSAGAGVCGRSCRLGKSRGRGRREGSLRAPVCRGLSGRLSCAVATGAAVGGRWPVGRPRGSLRPSACLQLLSRPPQG